MRLILSIAFLFVSCFALAQEGGQITVVASEPYLRGKINTFSVLINDKARNLNGIAFKITNGAYANPEELIFVSEFGQPFIRPGELLLNKEFSISGTKANSHFVLNGPYAFSSDGFSSGSANAILGQPVSGPGELFKVSVYIPIHIGQCGREINYCTPHTSIYSSESVVTPTLSQVIANDPNGESITLSTSIQPVEIDLRRFGDLNRDYALTLADVILTLRGIVGLRELTTAERWYADVYPTSITGKPMENKRYLGDGKVDLNDTVRQLQVIVGLWQTWWPDPK